MSSVLVNSQSEIFYPESDGRPMAENTKQYEWIVLIREGINSLVPDFVAADLFWYPVEGNAKIVQAPDVMVTLGRPKGHRRSYKQWEEANIAPQVVFEILSPGNTLPEMFNKSRFYLKYGVSEYYIYDPETNQMWGHLRHQDNWQEIRELNGWVSPLLGIKFEFTADDLTIYYPNGKRFLSYEELQRQNQQLNDQNQQLNDQNQQLNDQNQQLASKAEKLAAKLKELGINADEL